MNQYELDKRSDLTNILDEKSLKNRLGVSIIRDDIVVTDLGTVTRKDKQPSSEITYDSFIKEVATKIKTGTNLIRYDEETNSFYLVESNDDTYIAHRIDLNKKTMEDYTTGTYTETTLKMHGLLLRSQEMIDSKRKEQIDSNQINAIIAKANQNLSELSPIEARMYLDYLREKDKNNNKSIVKDSAKITAAAGIPLAAGISTEAILFAPGAAFAYTVLAGVLGATMGSIVEGLVTMIATNSPTIDLLPVETIKRLAKNIKKDYKKIKLTEQKKRN